MHRESVPATLVRLFAIGLIIYAFRNADMAMLLLMENRSGISDAYMLLSGIAVPAILAGLLWIAPSKVISLYDVSPKETESSTLDALAIFSVGVALMGLYLFVTAAAFLFDWLLTYSWQRDRAEEFASSVSPNYIQLSSEIFLLIIGLAFFFGSSAVAKVFSYARNFGVESAHSPNKRFNRTPEESGATDSDKSGGGAG